MHGRYMHELGMLLDKAFKSDVHQPTILICYVDDLFSVFNNEAQLDVFFNVLNSIHPNIKFTKELECNN